MNTGHFIWSLPTPGTGRFTILAPDMMMLWVNRGFCFFFSPLLTLFFFLEPYFLLMIFPFLTRRGGGPLSWPTWALTPLSPMFRRRYVLNKLKVRHKYWLWTSLNNNIPQEEPCCCCRWQHDALLTTDKIRYNFPSHSMFKDVQTSSKLKVKSVHLDKEEPTLPHGAHLSQQDWEQNIVKEDQVSMMHAVFLS